MKIYCILGLYLVFILSLLFGYNAGSSLERATDQIANSYATPMASVPSSQHNILLIQVDQADIDKPRLLSVWLMAYYTNSSRVDLLPIYPTHKLTTNEKDRNLPREFNLTKSGEPADGFWQALKGFNTWWNGYLMMDTQGLQKLESQLVGPSTNEAASPLQGLNPPMPPQVGTGNEVDHYQQLCQAFSQNSGSVGFYKLYFSLKDHLQSNLTPGQLQDIWQQLKDHGPTLTCNFPSLQAIIP